MGNSSSRPIAGRRLPVDEVKKAQLLDFPTDVTVRILCNLDTSDLLSCTKVCRLLRDIVQQTPDIQYHLELGLMGLVDSGQSGYSLPLRSNALQKYKEAWLASQAPRRFLKPPYDGHRLYRSNDVSIYVTDIDTEDAALIVHRSASELTGLPETRYKITAWKGPLEPSPSFDSFRYLVDLSQDLLIIVEPKADPLGPFEGEHRVLYNLFTFSISDDLYPHRLASVSPITLDCTDSGFSLDVFKDLIVFGGHGKTTDSSLVDIRVMSWQTTALVSEHQQKAPAKCHFIGQDLIAVVGPDSISVFDVHPDSPHAEQRMPLLHLKLPGVPRLMYLTSSLPNGCYNLHRDDRPYFQPDPKHRLLAIRLSPSIVPDCGGDETYIFLVPIATILHHLDRSRARTDTRSALPFLHRGSGIPWNHWGPAGTRLVHLQDYKCLSLEVRGSRCALTYSRTTAHTHVSVVVLDLHPYALYRTQAALVDLSGLSCGDKKIPTRYPCRTQYEKQISAIAWAGSTMLTNDDVALIRDSTLP